MSDQQLPGETPHDAEKTHDAEKKKKKKDKVRSAWISFVGRIVAQAVGATATVVLGLTVMHSYASPKHLQAASAQTDVFVAILPIDRFSTDPAAVGKRVRITVQLVEKDDQPAMEAISLQAEVASAIARAVSVAPPHEQQSRLSEDYGLSR